jgi:hypothetical protein
MGSDLSCGFVVVDSNYVTPLGGRHTLPGAPIAFEYGFHYSVDAGVAHHQAGGFATHRLLRVTVDRRQPHVDDASGVCVTSVLDVVAEVVDPRERRRLLSCSVAEVHDGPSGVPRMTTTYWYSNGRRIRQQRRDGATGRVLDDVIVV